MVYQINPVDGFVQNDSLAGSFPATYQFALYSAWIKLTNNGAGFQMLAENDVIVTLAKKGVHLSLDPPISGTDLVITLGDGSLHAGDPFFAAAAFVTTSLLPNVFYNLLVSIDSHGTIQAYINDAPLALDGPAVWHSLTSLIAQPVGISTGAIAAGALNAGTFTNPCIADLYWGLPGSFFDLSVTANRRKFIDGSGNPVSLGANGELPLGTAPLIFLSRGPLATAASFLTNLGSGGGVFTYQATAVVCDAYPPSIAVVNAQMADVWFAKTADFVDLDTVANRRRFIDDTGAPVTLGADGSRPFGAAPQAFFSRSAGASADSFAVNRGSGGAFGLSGGDLADAASAPSCSIEVTTVFTPGSAGLGVVGDYRNGNLYAFNMDTLQDNGSPRKWVRAWRALIKPVRYPVSFGSLTIDMQTGAAIAPGVTPAIMLRWSDDGGHTWSQPRIMRLAPLGGTAYRVRATRLGATRLASGLDRIWELSSRDPFKVALLRASMDAG